ncbi:MAG TPA: NADH-quinone oxidoreductase subunit F, partial [Clostridiales bacterium]|nr:NADH-quinone oxidoreductase subunit F [Clostridiales bacterium]
MIRSAADLEQIQETYRLQQKNYRYTVLICAGAGCISCGCLPVRETLVDELSKAGLTDAVQIKMTGCMGNCDVGPSLLVRPGGVFYCKVKPEDMATVVKQHLVGGEPVERLCYVDRRTGQRIIHLDEISFFNRQKKIVLGNCGKIDFDNLDEYIANDGFIALHKVLTSMSPEQVIDEIKKSGLRGRGGGGFPTALKWSLGNKAQASQKYIICNADEGDPGAFMNRSVLESDPHSVIEGMIIAAYTIGASQGFVYCRAEYPIAVQTMNIAIEQARSYGLLGNNIFGTDFYFDMEVRKGAGAFVCGEETALISSIEGKRGEPYPKPPFPATQGVFGKPTNINNVETYAN